MTDIPQGIVRNNPFDMMFNPDIVWAGQRHEPGEDLLYFSDPVLGLRAGMKDAHTKVYVDGLDTLETLIPKFAPPSQNNTPQYIRNMRTWLAMQPKQKLDLSSVARMVAYAMAVNRQEVGLNPKTEMPWFTNSQYIQAAQMALNINPT